MRPTGGFAPRGRPLSSRCADHFRSRVSGVLSTSGAYVIGQVAYYYKDDTSIRAIPNDTPTDRIHFSHITENYLENPRKDPNCIIPIDALRAAEATGSIGELAPQHRRRPPQSEARYVFDATGSRFRGALGSGVGDRVGRARAVSNSLCARNAVSLRGRSLLCLRRNFVGLRAVLTGLAFGRSPFPSRVAGFQARRLLLGLREIPLASFKTIVWFPGQSSRSP